MEAPCLAHKFERLQTTSDGPRPEIRPNMLREGEVTPFKICVVILLREHYALQLNEAGRTPEQRIAALLCLNDLCSIPDLTFHQFKKTLLDPDNCLHPEVIQSLLNILQELDRNNIGFLNDFANTMIEINESSQSVVILKKKIGRNGVFGRFVRMVLISIRKMTVAQTMHVYQELCLYVGLAYKQLDAEEQATTTAQRKVPPGPGVVATATKEVVTMEQDATEPTVIMQTESIEDECAMLEQTLSDTQISDEDQDDTSEVSEECGSSDMSVSLMETPSPTKLVYPTASTSSVGIGAEVEVKTILSTPASIMKPIGFIFDRMEKMVPYDSALNFSVQTLAAPMPSKESGPKYGLEAFEQMRKARVERGAAGLGTGLASNFVSRLEQLKKQAPGDREALQQSIYNDATAMDVDRATEADADEGLGVGQGEQKARPISEDVYNDPKLWSRALIESTIKIVTHSREFELGPRHYSARAISEFAESARLNPSAKVLLPQLHYMDYMNSLELKDVSRAQASLRASFDYRIKPTTSELSKAIPYASYNLAVLNERLGYREDARMFLEEAFQAGHSAADEMCLDYCQNLWSQFEGTTIKEQVRPVVGAKEAAAGVGKTSTKLHTMRAISRVLERLRKGGGTQLELINDLYKCTPSGPILESAEVVNGEALQLEALIAMLMLFGWHEWVRDQCEAVLDVAEVLNWPASTYCIALCTLAHLHLFDGDVEDGRELLEEGAFAFGSRTDPIGEKFNTQSALFEAMVAWLGGEPLTDELLATLAGFDPIESLYWLGYTWMLYSDFDGALRILRQLADELEEAKVLNVELKIRCLLLQGEVYCHAGTPTAALAFHLDALALATKVHSDFHTTMAKINLACVQAALELYNEAARTIEPLPVSQLLCQSPYLKARMHLLNVKLFLGMEIHDPLDLHNNNQSFELDSDTPPGPEMLTFIMKIASRSDSGRKSSPGRRPSASSGSGSSSGSSPGRATRGKAVVVPVPTTATPVSSSASVEVMAEEEDTDNVQKFRDGMADKLMAALKEAEDIFSKWNNSYRKKEILYLRTQVIRELQPSHVDRLQALKAEFEELDTHLMWNPKTCVI